MAPRLPRAAFLNGTLAEMPAWIAAHPATARNARPREHADVTRGHACRDGQKRRAHAALGLDASDMVTTLGTGDGVDRATTHEAYPCLTISTGISTAGIVPLFSSQGVVPTRPVERWVSVSLRSKSRDPKTLPRLLGVPKIKLSLLIEPALSGRIKRDGQPNSHLRANAGAAVQNRRQGLATHTKRRCRLGDTDSQGLETQRPKNLPGVRRIVHTHGSYLQW